MDPTKDDELTNLDPALEHCWHRVARSSEVGSQPFRAVLLAKPWVLWRDSNGKIQALEDRCPHRRAPLSLGCVVDDTIQCGYLGWRFDAEGICYEIPALGADATLPPRATVEKAFGVAESDDMVFMSPKEPVTTLPFLEEAEDASFMKGDLQVITTRESTALLADNFLDVAHFPFVHAGTFGAEEAVYVEPYEVQRDGLTSSVVFTHDFADREDPGVAQEIRPLIQSRRLTYRDTAPFHLSLRIEFLDAGGINTIGFFLCPEDLETTRVYSSLWRNDLEGDQQRMDEAIAFEIAVVEEDLALQSRYDILSVPLDPKEEVHSRADKSTIEMRRIMADVVALAFP